MKDFLKNNKKFISLPVFVFLFLILILAVVNLAVKEYNFQSSIKEIPLDMSIDSLPFFENPIHPNISAKSAVVMDRDSKAILYSKNPNFHFSLASTAKIMSALVALDHYAPNDILTVQRGKVNGVNVGFIPDERLAFIDVLYAMLLPSGNDAAFVLADNFPEGEIAFVAKMNEKAKKFELYNTNFADPAGLMDKKGYTTAIDLARLSSLAMENPVLREAVGTKTKNISDVTTKRKYVLNNLNRLLGVNGVNGVKTGYTDEAGEVLVTSKAHADENGNERTLIIVVMNSEDRFWDTSKIMYELSENLSYRSIHL